jgi:predicted Holliday junction resolvase-like endonuclease
MGGTTSTPAAIPVQSGISDPSFDQATSGVRITVAGTPEVHVNEDKVQKAYNKGKEDGVASFQSSLEQVAAQVYDGVHTKLTEIQEGSLKRSAQLVSHTTQTLPYFPKFPHAHPNDRVFLCYADFCFIRFPSSAV